MVSAVDVGLDVVQHLPFNPERLCILAAIPKFEPLGKEAVILKPLDMLRTERDQLQDLLLRQQFPVLHREYSHVAEYRDTRG